MAAVRDTTAAQGQAINSARPRVIVETPVEGTISHTRLHPTAPAVAAAIVAEAAEAATVAEAVVVVMLVEAVAAGAIVVEAAEAIGANQEIRPIRGRFNGLGLQNPGRFHFQALASDLVKKVSISSRVLPLVSGRKKVTVMK